MTNFEPLSEVLPNAQYVFNICACKTCIIV